MSKRSIANYERNLDVNSWYHWRGYVHNQLPDVIYWLNKARDPLFVSHGYRANKRDCSCSKLMAHVAVTCFA